MSKSRHTSEPSQELVTLPLDSIVPYWRNSTLR